MEMSASSPSSSYGQKVTGYEKGWGSVGPPELLAPGRREGPGQGSQLTSRTLLSRSSSRS